MTSIGVSKAIASMGGWAVMLAMVAVPVQAGCGGACNEAGCETQRIVSVVGDDDPNAVAPGSYEVVLMLDGEVASCPVTVPDDGDASCFAEDGSVSSLVGAYPVTTATGAVIYVNLNGEPKLMTVTVHRDQVEVATSTQKISYYDQQPNGADCPPTCRWAFTPAVIVPTAASLIADEDD